jgi:hypothetical protein
MRTRATVFSAFLIAAALAMVAHAQQLDICGCKNNPGNLGSFDSAQTSTYANLGVSTTITNQKLQIPLPADGVFVLSGLNLVTRANDSGLLNVTFIKNPANTPVTVLVDGNVTIGSGVTLSVSGDSGTTGSTNNLGVGGNGGPGAGRGGDGAYYLINFAAIGGAGLRGNPNGGAGATVLGTTGAGTATTGIFMATSDLLPLIGGGGGGGGASTLNSGSNCAGGGGGGGGGAILIAANGTVTINGTLKADGGDKGFASSTCASAGAGGSGGAIRILANTIAGTGSMSAIAGTLPNGSRPTASYGAIRLEALTNTFPVSGTDPLAARTPGPGPVFNVFNPTVAITSVGGQTVPANPQGVYGGVDVVLPVPGSTQVVFSTNGVPVGTTVNVTVKPKVGTGGDSQTATLANCANGTCIENVSFNLAAGSYFIEARATFATP